MSDRKNYRKHGKIFHNDKLYYRVSHSQTNYYLGCVKKGCRGRATESLATGQISETRPHSCVVTPYEREKDAATERLRELTLAVRGNAKAVDLVRSVLKDVSPEARKLMPTEDSLVHRVRKWAREYNIQLTKATPEDYLIPEGEEPLIGFGETDGGHLDQSTSSQADDPLSETTNTRVVVVKTGFVYVEPVAGLAECEDKKPAGLIYLKGRVNGHYTALIDGHTFVWRKNVSGGRLLYECREAKNGCVVTVIVDNDKKKYELRGSHVHQVPKKNKRADPWALVNVKRLEDDSTNEPSPVTDDRRENVPFDSEPHRNTQSHAASNAPSFHDDVGDDDNDYVDQGGDDFQMDFEPESDSAQIQFPHIPQHKSTVVSTSSSPCKKPHSKPKNAAKTGELCIVCGDELIVSEKLAASEEVFRKACCYLNVKSDGAWFPTAKSSDFYSFCELCTNEVINIHSLYKKVEEIQSLIFKKVENVEKRIADAEIVDNWMAEAPRSSAVRFEGFRKQVLINYRNKLKLRREIRFGKKTGQALSEIQPSSSAHMFAKDPCETAAFCKIIPESVSTFRKAEVVSEAPRRTRGRPKSKKSNEEREAIEKSNVPEQPTSPVLDDIPDALEDDDGGFHHDFDDSQDAMSVSSEREVKFWEHDPSKLQVNRREKRRTKKKFTNDDEEDDGDDDGGLFDNEDDDPDYSEEDDEDEDWGPAKKVAKKSGNSSKGRGRPLKESPADATKAVPVIPPGKIFFAPHRKKMDRPAKPKSRFAGPSHSHNIKFPDAILKDGRVFMEGIEIIKNPPGVYKPRPYSVSYSCGTCGHTCMGFWNIRHHICGHHLGLYKCPICQKEFCDSNIIQRHMETYHGQPKTKDCPECGKPVRVYKKDKELNHHRWIHLSEEEKQDPQFKGWCPPDKDPNRVRKVRTQLSVKMCVQCGKTFRSSSAFKRHELAHATGQDVISLICHYCGKTFGKRKGLNQHVKNCARKAQGIVNLPTYSCPKCTTRFTTRGARSRHVKKYHSNVTNVELPFTCPKCPRSFSTRSGFRNHKRVCIDGEKGYNNKSAEPQPSTSSQSSADVEFKVDSTDSTSTSTVAYNQLSSSVGSSQYGSSTATALGFNYHFMPGSSSGFSNNQYQS